MKSKMKPKKKLHINVKPSSYAKYNVDSNSKDLKFKTANQVRTSKHINIFAKWYAPNCSAEFL